MILPVILSGGAGSRLWPLSHAAEPKQLLALVGQKTMVQDTAERLSGPGLMEAAFVCNAAHADAIAEQVPGDGALILEPAGRNTAPCAAVAALHAKAVGAELVLLSPADHHVTRPDAFRAAVEAATGAARAGHLVTFGITPTIAATGYGYIRAGGVIDGEVRRVDAFVEKPDHDTAKAYLATGDYSWNAGLFLFAPDTMLRELRSHAPTILEAATRSYELASHEGRRIALDPESFAACPSRSLDYAVMEPTERAAVLPVDMGWSDIGSFAALLEVRNKDEHGISAPSGTATVCSRDCLVASDGPRVSLVGVEGVGVVVRGGEVLVVALDQSQDVKRVVEELRERGEHERL